MKTLCMISAFFPPVGGPIVQRVYKHTKFLREFGWNPVVVTRKTSFFYAFDDSLLNDLPNDLKIHRTFSLDYGFIKRFFCKKGDKILEDRRWDPKKIRRVSFGNFLRLFLLVPDGLIGWVPFAFWKAFRLRNSVDAYYLRLPPWSTGYLAPLLRIFTGKPVLVDYSDEWTTENIEFVIRPWFRQAVEKFLERIFIAASTWVSFSTESSKAHYEKKYPRYAHKFRVILNGFDEDDFKNINFCEAKSEKLRFIFTGTLDFRPGFEEYCIMPLKFFSALRELKEEIHNIDDRLEVCFIGSSCESVSRFVKEYGLDGIVKLMGYLPHSKAIEELFRADVLLLFANSKEWAKRFIPGKLFEYIRARKPIFALVPSESEIERLIEIYNAGVVVAPNDVEGIKRKIVEFLELKVSGELAKWRFSDRPLEEISRRSSTKRLVDILEEKVGRSKH